MSILKRGRSSTFPTLRESGTASKQSQLALHQGSTFIDLDVGHFTPLRLRASYCLIHPVYQWLMPLCIMAHMALTIVETDQNANGETREAWQGVCEIFFMGMYMVDLSLKMFIQRELFFYHRMNLFDLTIVGVDAVCAVRTTFFQGSFDPGPISLLRALRTLRIVRVLRNFIMFRDLYLMVQGMQRALRPILFAFLLIIAALTIFSIAAVEMINPVIKRLSEKGIYDDCSRCPRAFSSVMQANLTFFATVLAGDSWGKVSLPILEESPLTAIIIVAAFGILELGLLNVVVAVVVDRQAQAREEDKELQHTLKEEKIKRSHKELIRLFRQIDADGSGELSYEELVESYRSMEGFRYLLQSLDIREDDLETIFASMDRDGNGTVDYEEFVRELHRMRSVEIRTLVCLVRQNVIDTTAAVRKLADSIDVLATGGIAAANTTDSIDLLNSKGSFHFSSRHTNSTSVSAASSGFAGEFRTYDALVQRDGGWKPLGRSSNDIENFRRKHSANALRTDFSRPSMLPVAEVTCCDKFAVPENGENGEDCSAAKGVGIAGVGDISSELHAVPRTVQPRFTSNRAAFDV